MEYMNWNPVLNFILDIKNAYLSKFNDNDCVHSYMKYDYNNCLSFWIDRLNHAGYYNAGTFADIVRWVNINQKGDLILIKYTLEDIDPETFANFWDLYNHFYMECRSVVIDVKNECLALTPFRKFRNVGECEKNSIENIKKMIDDAHTVEITEKLDGSMVSARWYNGELLVAGSQALDTAHSFRLVNYYNWFNENPDAVNMLKVHSNYTFIFEGIFKNDPHVVHYDEADYGLHLIGIRNVKTGFDFSYNIVDCIGRAYGIPHVKPLPLTFQNVIDMTSSSDTGSDEAEGFVISIDGYKVKCKFVDYVLMHKSLNVMVSPNYIIDAIKNDRWDDWYAKIPEVYKPRAKEIADDIFKYINLMNKIIDSYINYIPKDMINSRKDSMIYINNNVPKIFAGKVRSRYLGQKINLFSGVKYNDIKDFLAIFA